jgi:hypothetical protein
VGLPVLVSLAFLLWYNDLRYGRLFVTSYNNGGFQTPLLTGIRGLLVSPGRGLFVFNLLAIPGLVGLILMWHKDKALTVLMALLIVPRLLFFSKWDSWQGGICWGPRFLMPIVSLFVIGAFSITIASQNPPAVWRAGRVAVALAAIPSALVSYLSVRVPYEQWHNILRVPSLRANIGPLAGLHGSPAAIFNRELWTWYGSIIRGNLLLLRIGKAEMAPALWSQHHPLRGWLILTAFAGGAALAIFAATLGDHRSGPEEVPRDLRLP